MADHLGRRLGGDDDAAVEPGADVEDIEGRAADAAGQLQALHDEAAQHRHAGLQHVGRQALGQRPHQKRHQAQHDIGGGGAGNPLDHGEAGERDQLADHRPAEHAPVDVLAPQHGAPAVRRHLGDGMQRHGRGDRQHRQQKAHQDQPAGHAEDARQERGSQDGGEQHGGEAQRAHGRLPATIGLVAQHGRRPLARQTILWQA